jgi:hypothetical protein
MASTTPPTPPAANPDVLKQRRRDPDDRKSAAGGFTTGGSEVRVPGANCRRPPRANLGPPPNSPTEQATVASFVRAYESGDLDTLVALLTDDAFMSMPPVPFEYEGRDVVARARSWSGRRRSFDGTGS